MDADTKAEDLDDETYILVQQQITAFAGVVRNMPLRAFLERIDRAESVAPMLDPTLFMRAGKNLAVIKVFAESLLTFQRAIQKLMGEGS